MFLIVSAIEVMVLIHDDDCSFFKLVFFLIIALSCFISIMDKSTRLSDRDVFNGKAEYVETIHISNGDTIKTYHIQPKK